MPRPTRLSATFVRNCRVPGRYGDGRGGRGLSLLVKPMVAGGLSRTFSQRLRVNGKPVDIGLGPLDLVSLAEAREIAIENAKLARAGTHPKADNRRRAAVSTFAQAVERTIAMHAPSWRNPRTADHWRSRLTAYAYPAFGEQPVNAIGPTDILGVLTPIWHSRREQARKVKQHLHAVMAWAIGEGLRGDNPVDAVATALPRAGAPVEHRKALPYAEVAGALAKIWDSEAAETTKLAVEFLTLTAARSGEVRGATWDEVDEYSATWTIPGSRMKTGREHRVPLSKQALAVLDRAREYSDGSSLLFPSVTGKTLSDNTLSKLFRDNKIAGTPHGMRTSFRTWLRSPASTGSSRRCAWRTRSGRRRNWRTTGVTTSRRGARSCSAGARLSAHKAWGPLPPPQPATNPLTTFHPRHVPSCMG